MKFQLNLIILLCLSSLCLPAQIEVDWTKSFDSNGIEHYLGAFPLATFDGEPFLAYKLRGEIIDDQNTWGFELLNATNGDATGNFITTNDVSPWNASDEDPDLNHLVKTENGYMAFLNERDRITFLKYDKELNILGPTDESSTTVEFDPSTNLYGFGLTESVGSSYGIVGATWGRDENSSDDEATPHIFACDTDLNVRFATRLDNASYYLGNRFLINVNSKDEIFTAGHTRGQELLRSDTVVISKLAANGALLYTNFLVLEQASLPRVLKMDMNADETELLLSGFILVKDFFNNTTTKAYVARINAEDGSVIELFTYSAGQLGGFLNQAVDLPMAQYDAEGNIVMAGVFINNLLEIDVYVSRIDLDGNFLDKTTLLSNLKGYPYPYAWRFNKIGDNLYLSGSYQIRESEDKEAFVVKLGTENVSTDISENLTAPISFRTSPNPTSGLLNIQWNNDSNGAYQVKIINQMSQEIQTYKGQVFSGPMNLEFNIKHLPAGAYFVKLELENGFAIQSIIKE